MATPQTATTTPPPADPVKDLIKEATAVPADGTPPPSPEIIDEDTPDDEDLEFMEALDKGAPIDTPKEEPPSTAPAEATGQPAPVPETAAPPPVSPKPETAQPTPTPSAEGQPSEAQPEAVIDIDLFAPEVAPQAAPPTAPAAAVPETQPQAPQVDKQAEFTRMREQAIEKFTEAYAFTPEETKQLMVEPEKVIPRVMARLHADVVQSVMAGIAQQLPMMMNSQRSVANEQSRFNREFFTAWPQLAQAVRGGKKEIVRDIQLGLRLQRQLDPTMTPDNLIRNVGAAVMVKHQMPIQMQAAPAATPSNPPVRPMNPGGGAAVPAPRGPKNWIDDMIESETREELDQD